MVTASTCSQYRMIRKIQKYESFVNLFSNLNNEFRSIARDTFEMSMTTLRLTSSGVLSCWTAGKIGFYVLSKDSTLQHYPGSGTPLGVSSFELGFQEMKLADGDRIILSTEGISKIMDFTHTDTENLKNFLTQTRNLTATQVTQELNNRIQESSVNSGLTSIGHSHRLCCICT